ncbi:MAG: DUF1569 domain-containing protein [Planctomycetota bacterium]
MPDAVDVRSAARRSIHLRTVEDIAAELDRIAAAEARGTLTTTGHWTPGENLDHVVKFMEMSMDGFPERAPWWVRAIGTVLKPFLFARLHDANALKPGTIDNRGRADFIEPTPGATSADAIDRGRRMIERLRSGERFEQRSPLFGTVTHEQWCLVHASHCNLHWSFLQLGHDA